MTPAPPDSPPPPPPAGSIVVDLSTEALAVVMDHLDGLLYLRRPGGGPEWTRTPQQVRPADRREQLRARVARLTREAQQSSPG
ncbi:hypothetical protein ACIGXM_10800 [Kitasatospora sp. NPDC052896]|uniref:hypothetical protein n=1 Tax=Kitasatospora sp. NPDC052896 TaxID=3364061 RepID=UPI0037C82A42